MSKEINSIQEHTNFEKLIYFRWKALIRSKEYKKFYSDNPEILTLPETIEDIEGEIRYIHRDVADVRNFKETHEDLLAELEELEDTQESILDDAYEKFGLIAAELEDLMPIDKPIDELNFAFKQSVNEGSGDRIKIIHGKNSVVMELTKKDIDSRIRSLSSYLRDGNKLFLIDTDMPIKFIITTLKAKLKQYKGDIPVRKDFDSWEEAFAVWDFLQQVKKQPDTKDFLLKTAQLMESATSYLNWKEEKSVTKQSLKDRVSNNAKVAEKLITLAGSGIFVSQ